MVTEAYCPYCKEDYNTISLGVVRCCNCGKTYLIEDWQKECEEAELNGR
jgi:transposase-like protein